MECWTSDSILEDRPWNKAKLKMVHYVDSATCSTCYLQKVAIYGLLFNMETQSNNDFYNVFIINPNIIAKKKLISDFTECLYGINPQFTVRVNVSYVYA